jgi:hypothetical protein
LDEIGFHVVNSGEFSAAAPKFRDLFPGLRLVHLRELPHTQTVQFQPKATVSMKRIAWKCHSQSKQSTCVSLRTQKPLIFWIRGRIAPIANSAAERKDREFIERLAGRDYRYRSEGQFLQR